ncbi:hypothetical protein [Streptomyces vinaceus]|uniref:hypothetical protein n=1 Tax=Streptomyces vinaceus TaxID=1960 RepID=UPI00380FA184
MRRPLCAWILVGASLLAAGAGPAYAAYDVRGRTTTDLGSLAGPSGVSAAAAVSGATLVGSSSLPGPPATPTHGFAYSPRTGKTADLGTLGGNSSTANAVSGSTVVGGDGLPASSIDLTTHTSAVIGSGRGVTEVGQISGNLLVGDNFAPNSVAFTARADKGSFAYLRPWAASTRTRRRSTGAAQVNGRGVVAGSAALAAAGPSTANGPFHATVRVPHPVA